MRIIMLFRRSEYSNTTYVMFGIMNVGNIVPDFHKPNSKRVGFFRLYEKINYFDGGRDHKGDLLYGKENVC